MPIVDLERFRLVRLQNSIQSLHRCFTIVHRAFPLNLRRISNLCLLLIALFTLNTVNCQDINQIHSIREIHRINSYKDVQIFRYFIPSDTSLATWSFIANTSLNCDPVDVTVYLRYRGIPVINFDNVTDQDVLIDDQHQYKIEFKANAQEYKFNISNPLFGEWFVAAFFEKTVIFEDVGDQVLNTIVEKTEIFDCRAWLISNLSFNRIKSITKLHFGTKHTDHIHNAKLFQFFVPMNAFSLNVNITQCKPIERNSFGQSDGHCPISLYLRGSGIPSRELNDKAIHCTKQDTCSLRSLDIVRHDENYLVIELQNSLELDKRFVNGAHVSLIVNTDNCHETVQLDDYIRGYPMIMTTVKTVEEETERTSTLSPGLFVAKKRVPLNELMGSESVDYLQLSTLSTTIPSTTSTTLGTTSSSTTTTTTPATTTTTPRPTTPSPTTTTTTQRTTTATEHLLLSRYKKPMLNQSSPPLFSTPVVISSTASPTTTTTTTRRPSSTTESRPFKYGKVDVFSATDIQSSSSDDLLNYAKMPKMKQPAQKKDSYPGDNKKISINKQTQFEKEFNENLDLVGNKEDKDYDEENENEDEIEEDEENDEDEDVLSNKNNFRNKNHNKSYGGHRASNQRNQLRGNSQIHNRNSQAKFNQNNARHRIKPTPPPEDDDEEEISRFTKNRKNPHEFDFTRRNTSRVGRVQRAVWQLENSIFESELSKISFVDQCPYRLQMQRHNMQGNFNFKYAQSGTSNARYAETSIQVPNTNVNYHFNDKGMKLSLVQFEIVPLLDVGGVLEVELGLNIDFDSSVNNVSVIACLKHNRIATSLNNCLNKLQVNSSSLSQNKLARTFIPYPASGQWFVSLIAFCHKDTQFPHHGLSGHSNPPIGQESKECDRQYSSVVLNIRSASCNEENCPSKRGACRNQLQNGLAFSYCECRPSYYGFTCKEQPDNSKEEVQQQLLTELLVLSLSNLLWLPVIIIALYKSLWVESLIYVFTMFLASSLHVCSSTSSYSICLVSPVTLEFGCLFISCLCVCVTIISLSDMAVSLKSTFHMFAALFVALLIHLNWSPFWMYTCSSILFSLIMLTSWLVNCCRGSCFPSCKLWFFSIIPAFTTLGCAFGLLLYPPVLAKYITDSVFNLLLPVSVLFLIYSINNPKKEIISASNSLTRMPTRPKDNQHFSGKGISSDTYYELIAEGASHLARNPQYVK